MPGIGNPQFGVRLSRETVAAVEAQLDSLAQHGRGPVPTFSQFVERAVVEHLRKMARSRGRRGTESHVAHLRPRGSA